MRPTARVDDVEFYGESPFGRDLTRHLTRQRDAEMCVFLRRAWFVATICCLIHFTELCLFTIVSVAALHLLKFLFRDVSR